MIKKILLVDDSPMIHKLLRRTLEEQNYQICGDAQNGKEGVELYKKLSPDLVFMDITMPIMDGIQAAREIKSLNRNAKIIMLSAMGDEEIIKEAEAIGIKIFLKKPFNNYMIASAISKVI